MDNTVFNPSGPRIGNRIVYLRQQPLKQHRMMPPHGMRRIQNVFSKLGVLDDGAVPAGQLHDEQS